jgi:TRAP-type mannitol/chloroaromatic compound transport system permease large subunit
VRSFPGLLLAGLYFIYILIRCNINPELGPPISKEEAKSWSAAKQKWAMTLKSLIPPLALILAVMGTILAGIATPTEAAGLGAAGAALLARFQQKNELGGHPGILLFHHEDHRYGDDALYRRQILQHGVPEHGRRRRGGRSDDRFRIEPLGGAIHHDDYRFSHGHVHRLGRHSVDHRPIFMPIVLELDFNPLWFSLLMCVNLQTSFVTPPFGYALFYFAGVAPKGYTMMHIYKGIMPFVILQLIGLAILVLFPGLTTWLPALFFGAS